MYIWIQLIKKESNLTNNCHGMFVYVCVCDDVCVCVCIDVCVCVCWEGDMVQLGDR